MAIEDVQHPVMAAQAAFGPFAAIAPVDDPCWRGGAGPLAGLLTSVKDIVDVAGLPTRRGSRLSADAPPATADAGAVARLRAAGAAIVAKSTTTEHAHSPLGYAPLEGLTRNPWNPARTCGGSSSGAGVAVATGATPLALATDAGCSTRLPAALSGVFGLKPTLGRIPHEKLPDCFANIVHLGLITASVDLMERAHAVLAHPHRLDAQSLGLPPFDPPPFDPPPFDPPSSSGPGLEGARILLWLRVGNDLVDPAMLDLMDQVRRRLEVLGARVDQADCPLPNPTPAWRVLQQSAWADRMGGLPPDRRALLSPSLDAGIEAGLRHSAVDMLRALATRTAMFRAVQSLLGTTHDYIVTPCASAPAVAADHPVDAPLEIGGRVAGPLRDAWLPYLSLFDLSGHPALSLPAGMDGAGVPMGFQMVAPWAGEAALLRAARQWEAAFPFPALPRDWLTL